MIPPPPPPTAILDTQAHESLGALLTRARHAREAGRTEEALRAYGLMLAQVPAHETALLERAETLAWAGRYREAAEAYRVFRKVHPGRSLDADLRLAQLAAWQNRTGEALDLLNGWLKQEHRQAVLDAATYLSWGGRMPESLRRLRSWLESHPEDREARLLEAKILGWDGQFAEARAAYGKVLARTPSDREALAGLARLDLWEGSPGRAHGALDRMATDDRNHPESQLLQAQIDLAEGASRAARARTSTLATRPGPSQKEARELLEDLTGALGPWVELSAARTDTNEGLRLEDPLFRARVPLGDGALDLGAGQHRTGFRDQVRSTRELSLGITHPIGPRWRASASVSRLSDLAGEPAWGHTLGLGLSPSAGLDLRLDHSRSLAIFTPAALAQRTAFSSTDLGASWRFGRGRHALGAGLGHTDVSAGSTRRSFFGSYEYRIPVTGFDLRVGALTRGFGYSTSLPLGFFNPERYRWNGATASLAWHKGRAFEAALNARTGYQVVNQGQAQFTWSYGAALSWTPQSAPVSLFASWSHSMAGLPVTDPTDPADYREHTLRVGLRLRGERWF